MANEKPPILVVVKDGQYNMFGRPTVRNRFLAKLLMSRGGVNENIADGIYNFNMAKVDLFHIEISLLPVNTE